MALEELVAAVADLRHRPRRHRARALRQRPRLRHVAQLDHPAGDTARHHERHGRPRADATIRTTPASAAPAIVTGASSGIGAATGVAPGRGRPPGRAGRPTRRPAARRSPRPSAARAARRSPCRSTCSTPSRSTRSPTPPRTQLGPIEILVSNAGDVQPITTVGARPEEFARQLGVNLLGAQALVHRGRAADAGARPRRRRLRHLRGRARARAPHMAAYVASKAGLEGFAQAMAMESEGTGVRVGIVRPGPSTTEQGTTLGRGHDQRGRGLVEHWGLLRHNGALRPEGLAGAVLAMVVGARRAPATPCSRSSPRRRSSPRAGPSRTA